MMRLFRNLSLYHQLIIPLIAIGSIGLFATIYSALQLEKSVSSLGSLYDASDLNLGKLENLESSLAYYRVLTLRHISSEDPDEMAELGIDLQYTEDAISRYLNSIPLSTPNSSSKNRPLNQQLTRTINAYLNNSSQIIRLSLAFDKETALDGMSDLDNITLPGLNRLLSRLKRQEFEKFSALRQVLADAADRNLTVTTTIGIGGGIIALLLTSMIIRQITQRLSKLVDWSLRAADGNLTASLFPVSDDEVGQLTRSMQVMANNILAAHGALDEAKKNAEHVAEERRIYSTSFEKSGQAMLITDSQNRIINANATFTAQTGYELHEIIGRNPRLLASEKTDPLTYRKMWDSLNDNGFWEGEVWDRKKTGEIFPKWLSISAIRQDKGDVLYYIASFVDITERKNAEARIEHLAHHDILTGLHNRFSLEGLLQQAIANAQRHRNQLALLFMDLDRFKHINDTLGHHVGDELLIAVANRLRNSVRDSDIVARIGGDEFVIVLTELQDNAHAGQTAQKIIKSIGQPFHISDQEISTSPSVGISLYPSDGNDVDNLLRTADAAMYHAKESGRNTYHYFDESLFIAANTRLTIERDLRTALNKGQLGLHFQPIMKTSNLQVVCLEALCRWQHPEQGFIPPDVFIPIAETSGMIHELGEWVIDEVCQQIKTWNAAGLDSFRVSINLSVRQLQNNSLVDGISKTLEKYQLDGNRLSFEITETAAMHDTEQAIRQLDAIRKLGIELMIDDFGTGYSSLAYLRRLPIHNLKIDKSFVIDIESDANDAAICAATISLARNLGIRIVAEGVETNAQREFLLAHYSDFVQGNLLSKPMPAADVPDFLREKAGLTS